MASAITQNTPNISNSLSKADMVKHIWGICDFANSSMELGTQPGQSYSAIRSSAYFWLYIIKGFRMIFIILPLPIRPLQQSSC